MTTKIQPAVKRTLDRIEDWYNYDGYTFVFYKVVDKKFILLGHASELNDGTKWVEISTEYTVGKTLQELIDKWEQQDDVRSELAFHGHMSNSEILQWLSDRYFLDRHLKIEPKQPKPKDDGPLPEFEGCLGDLSKFMLAMIAADRRGDNEKAIFFLRKLEELHQSSTHPSKSINRKFN